MFSGSFPVLLFSKLPFDVKAANQCKMLRMDTGNNFIQCDVRRRAFGSFSLNE